jgi:ariadne-1
MLKRVLTFSLKRNNMTELFEDNQRDLERAVENLGYSLEQNPEPDSITKLRTDITNQSVSCSIQMNVPADVKAYVQKRHDILLDDTLKGYLEVSH